MPICPPWRLLLLLSSWRPLLGRAETDSVGQTAGELYQRWERYRRECQETLEAVDPPADLACNASFDMYVCWDYAAPNVTARASCPWYLPWHRHVAAGFVLRQCGSDGQWGPWRDHSQCENPEKNGAFQDQRLILERLQVMYTVGYSLSLATLLLALLILSFFRCWERNDVKAIWWIIRTPILMTILINFLIFIRILGILVSKLRTRQMRCPDYRLRLARSTLTLVPLLGVHEVVFAPVTEEQARGALRFTKLGFEIFLSSFQGFLVSVLYCFINKEVGTASARRPRPLAAAQGMAGNAGNVLSAVALQVQSEIRRCWHRCRLRHSLGEEQRQPPERASRPLPLDSGPCRVAADGARSLGTLPGSGDEASRVLESYC
ncbi:gastric inhibitory polypeptide receptor isoform X3 [Vulpes lagopus]|uniref:gastric inhibitory polypeptide receptor isoform X3 n=1 Tax=Vulpes lagopus TaxID=494514 RepID=UPI001BC991B5|nr:gastric inhibitory polypeptide receptor isoform X3 [Vulpes lagopus]